LLSDFDATVVLTEEICNTLCFTGLRNGLNCFGNFFGNQFPDFRDNLEVEPISFRPVITAFVNFVFKLLVNLERLLVVEVSWEGVVLQVKPLVNNCKHIFLHSSLAFVDFILSEAAILEETTVLLIIVGNVKNKLILALPEFPFVREHLRTDS
jgi:hypothetical protein